MSIALILGTRPEIIKMSPVIRELNRKQANFFILHTGQHYSYNLDKVFFEQLDLPQPRYNLDVGSGSHATETSKMLVGIEKVLLEEKPEVVLVQGDTNSVLAGALAASKLAIKVGHIEAGLRSYDRTMPEEINRILTDHCADLLFAPTEKAEKILLGEGIPADKIFVTGNTIVDAVYQNRAIAREKGNILDTLKLKAGEYFVVTLHRQENVDDKARFASVLDGLDQVATKFETPLIYPMHPRARKMMTQFGLHPQHIRLIEPLDFLGFLHLESNARLIFTDSGGIQEETCILNVPCVTLRDNTERPETLDVGANILAGASPQRIVECATLMLGREPHWHNPFGDGTAGSKIVKITIGDSND
ncbi:MAG: UDP-N-acetylglucosamine 2-epimerase (non-hydrolyzing) [Dehalococcoidales bacterium]|nr:UDP-N-acetylglucosamine 2-epimerase (non-hydrolyzing) [Dehalococcoidales bacterium]